MAEGPPWKDCVTQVPPEDALDQPCTDQVLNDIALDVVEWETVAALLGLSRPERMDIVSKHSPSPRMQKIAMFEKWKAKFGNAATYRKLTDVFWKLRDSAVIERIVQLLLQEQQSATESPKSQSFLLIRSGLGKTKKKEKKIKRNLEEEGEGEEEEERVGEKDKLLLQGQQSATESPISRSFLQSLLIRSSLGKTKKKGKERNLEREGEKGKLPLQEQQSATESPKGLVLEKYQKFLKRLYCERSAEYLLHWPPVPHYKYVDLSMTIPKDKVRYGTPDVQHTMAVMRGIIGRNNPRNVKLCKLFKKDPSQHKKILIEGAPGSGKTTITWHICKQWGMGEMFNDLFDVVVMVQLRDPDVHSAQSLVELLPRSPSDPGMVAKAMLKAEGEKSLVIYDGLDELPRQSKCYEWLLKLLHKPSSVGLAKSCVIITSRPSASVNLHTKVSSRIKIQGFTESKRMEYFKESCDDVDALMHQLSSRPYLLSICYLPLNCAIVAHLFRALDNLPSSESEFFFLLICNCILRYIEKEMPESTVEELSSFDELPSQLVSPFSSICNLALDGTIKDKILFSSRDLKVSDLAIESHLGLLHVVQSLVSCGRSFTCNFPHLSVQEYLAAYCISQISSETERCDKMKAIANNDRFSAVFHFFTSITKLKTECDISLFKKFLRTLCKEYGNRIESFVAVLHEAQSEALCQYTSEVFEHQMDLKANSLFDYVSIGYFLYAVCLSDGVFCLTVTEYDKDDKSLLSLLRELHRLCSREGRELKGSIHLKICYFKSFLPMMEFALKPPISNLTLCIPYEDEMLTFFKMLRNSTSLVRLLISIDGISTSDVQQLQQYIFSALVCNETLKSLWFFDCSHNYEGSLCRAVMQNRSLEELGLFLVGSSDSQTFLQMLPEMNLKRAHLGIIVHLDSNVILKNVWNALVANTSLLYLNLMVTFIHMRDPGCFDPTNLIESLTRIASKNRTLKELVVTVASSSSDLDEFTGGIVDSFFGQESSPNLPTEHYHRLATELLEAASTNTVLESLTLAIPNDANTLDIKSTLKRKLDALNATRTEHGLKTLKFNIKFIRSW